MWARNNTMREMLGGCRRPRGRRDDFEHVGVCCEIGRDEGGIMELFG